MTVTCNDPAHELRRAEEQHGRSSRVYQDALVRLRASIDRHYGTPCIICGAPIVNGYGHDAGCMGLDS